MKIFSFLITTTLLLIAPTILWADALQVSDINIFNAGDNLSSAKMNDNFAATTDAINQSHALVSAMPTGMFSIRRGLIHAPRTNDGGPFGVLPFVTGCDGQTVRVAAKIRGYVANGDNPYSFIIPAYKDITLLTSAAKSFRMTRLRFAGTYPTSAFLWEIAFYRDGAHANDTCDGNLNFWGVEIHYNDSNGVKQEIFVPATAMSR